MFASRDAYGLYAASKMHAEARRTGQSITVSFCGGDATDGIMRLIETIDLAQSMGIDLPDKRTIILANVSLQDCAIIKLSCLMLVDDSIYLTPFFLKREEMNSIDTDEIEHMVRLMGFDEYLYELADTLYNRWRG